MGVTIAAVITGTDPVGSVRRSALLLGLALLVGLSALAACGGHDSEPGAALPAAQPGAARGGPTSAAATPDPAANDSPSAATATVAAYFREINDASRGGRVATTGTTALAGCQPCAIDVGATRSLQQRGLHADGTVYQVSDLSTPPRVGLVTTTTFAVQTNAVGLLDAAGRHVSDAAGVPTRYGTAQLALTAHGWRISSLRYASAPA
ncbi:hypothetical protein [Frankia sp. AgKG'84/4]|uniref:hypothetical protein n=1 Tax=Frankia sp. AgKG'84/4 TaxID=573490 RepID=UPI00202A5CCC|nr:hypothetical protein [Frankia sp. AgKG'84/4]MCL9794328.1 hypothetical protein [Frankia sp. AgKG'84/4]